MKLQIPANNAYIQHMWSGSSETISVEIWNKCSYPNNVTFLSHYSNKVHTVNWRLIELLGDELHGSTECITRAKKE